METFYYKNKPTTPTVGIIGFYRTWFYIWVTRRMSYKKQELRTLHDHLSSFSVFLVGSVLLIVLVFCVALLCVFTFWVPCCDVHYDCRINTVCLNSICLCLFTNSGVQHILCICFCLCLFTNSGVQHILCICFCFVCVCFVYPLLPLSLDCLFLIAPSVFSNVYYTPTHREGAIL
jgi:hypothetical protein